MITPLKDRVIIELVQKETTTASGIVLSSADPAEANRGIVLSIGEEVLDVKAVSYTHLTLPTNREV